MSSAGAKDASGLWQPGQLRQLWYGSECVRQHLLDALPSADSRAFIITGASLATKTALVKQVEQQLGDNRHAGTFSGIRQHAPIADVDKAAEGILSDDSIDTVISIGGGSPIDSAKAISYRLNEKASRFLFHIAIPTTLSAAECNFISGFTNAQGLKIGVSDPRLAPQAIFYDAKFGLETPPRLLMSTGMRALDHAVELMYNPSTPEFPTKDMALKAASDLFSYLPRYAKDPKNEEYINNLFLASYASLGFLGTTFKGPIGLSHTLGYALGSPYSIPHGITSCLTLGHVVQLQADDPRSAEQIARLLPAIGLSKTGNDREDARKVGAEIIRLVSNLGLATRLNDWHVRTDQAETITKLATKAEGGELFDRVLQLVKSLY